MKILCLYLGGHPSCLGGIETFERNLKKCILIQYHFSP